MVVRLLPPRFLCRHLTKPSPDVSDPEETMVERDSLDEPEWLDVDARGFCYRCSELPPQEYHDRKAAGELDGDDPWGELSVTPAAVAGGSGSKPKYSQRAIASGIPDPTPKKLLQVDDYAVDLPSHPAYDDDSDEEQPAAISRPSSPDQAPTLTRAKGKGRVGQPEETYAPRYGAPEPVQAEPETESEDDDAPVHSDLEDEIRRPKGKAPKSKAPKEEEDPSTEDEDEDEVETIPRGSRKSTTTIRDQGNKSSRSAARAESNSSSSSSQSSDYEGDEDDDDYAAGPPPGNPPTEGVAGEPFFIISPEDRAKYGIPPGHPLTERQFEAWKDRRAAEGRRAMAQHAKGEIDEE